MRGACTSFFCWLVRVCLFSHLPSTDKNDRAVAQRGQGCCYQGYESNGIRFFVAVIFERLVIQSQSIHPVAQAQLLDSIQPMTIVCASYCDLYLGVNIVFGRMTLKVSQNIFRRSWDSSFAILS